MKLNNNDDSHNSGLNLLIYNMLLDIESHPAWVCGLKLSLQQLHQPTRNMHLMIDLKTRNSLQTNLNNDIRQTETLAVSRR